MLKIKTVSVLSVILLLCSMSFIPFFSADIVSADPTSGSSTFYFTDYMDFVENGGIDSMDIMATVSELPPSSPNISYYPPKLIDGLSINQEEWLIWLTLYSISIFSDEFDGYLGDLDLLLPNPLRIIEAYPYDGNETIPIQGDIEFDLYFSSRNDNNDQIVATVYTLDEDLPLPREINSSGNITISSSSITKPIQQSITVKDIDINLRPGMYLVFSLEFKPGSRAITSMLQDEDSFLSKLTSRATDFLLNLAKQSSNPTIQDAAELIDEVRNLSEDLNFSKEDFAEIINSVIGSSLVYDHSSYPTSVTVPFESADSQDGNEIKYYLNGDGNLIQTKPTGDPITTSLASDMQTWSSGKFSRSKYLIDATAILYINHKDYNFLQDNMMLDVSLFAGSSEIASKSISFEKTTSFPTTTPQTVLFNNIDSSTEISYDESISLSLSLSNGSNVGQGFFRSISLYHNGAEYPSSLTLTMSDTDHIQASPELSSESDKIIPGETVSYIVNVSSDFEDDITVSLVNTSFSEDEKEFWDVTIDPSEFSIGENSKKEVQVDLTSTIVSLLAYEEDPLEIELEILGKTGYTKTSLSAEVSEEAVTFDTIVSSANDVEIEHGSNHTYIFNITNNNTGLWPHGYRITANSENNWTIDLGTDNINDLESGNTISVSVTIYVPEDTDIDKDMLTFTVKSKETTEEIYRFVNTSVLSKGPVDAAFGFFESLAKDLGLEEAFGEFAPYIIPLLLIIIIFIIIIIMVFILTSKSVDVICVERIKEIYPNEFAEYQVSIKNPSTKHQIYEVDAIIEEQNDKWETRVSEKTVTLAPKQEKLVKVQIRPTDEIESDDWAKILFIVSIQGSNKLKHLELLTMINNGTTELSISNVFHWPKPFKKNEKVSTSFKLFNNGSIQSGKVKISLYINGKEKNKVEDIIIPARGYADITIPWIAEKGKNDISIIVT